MPNNHQPASQHLEQDQVISPPGLCCFFCGAFTRWWNVARGRNLSRGTCSVFLRHCGLHFPLAFLVLVGFSLIDGDGAGLRHDLARLIGLNIPWRHGLFSSFSHEAPSSALDFISRWGIVQVDNGCVLRATWRALSHVLGSLERW